MTRRPHQPLPPRGLSRTEAAAYLGVGVDIFDRGIAAKLLPPPRLLFSKLIWDIQDLDRALDELPHRQPDGNPPSPDDQNAQSSEREQWLDTIN